MKRLCSRVLIVIYVGALSGLCAVAQQLHIIATGSVIGLYYSVGGAVSFIINNEISDLLLTVKVTSGSVANVEGLAKGEISLAIVQSDVMDEAYYGHKSFSTPVSSLRALMGLHAEPLHLVCRKDAGVRKLPDILGKRINLGLEGSGTLTTARAVLAAYGVLEQQLLASYHSPKVLPDLLIAGDIDCFFFALGIGGAAIQATASQVAIDLIPLEGAELRELLSAFPYYAIVTVPANTYPGVSEEVRVFGVKAFLLTTDALPDEVAYGMVRALLGELDTLKETYPLLESLDVENLLDGLSIPLHPGAERAYRELGLR